MSRPEGDAGATREGATDAQPIRLAPHVAEGRTPDAMDGLPTDEGTSFFRQHLQRDAGYDGWWETDQSKSPAPSSMAASRYTHSTAADSAPPLTEASSVEQTISNRTPSVGYQQYHLSSSTGDGLAPAHAPRAASPAPQGRLPCQFGFLFCRFRSDDWQEWDTHVRSHYRGALPPSAPCPILGCDWRELNEADPQRAWDVRMGHVRAQHQLSWDVDIDTKANDRLLDWLKNHEIIDVPTYKGLRRGQQPVANGYFAPWTESGPGSSRRRHDRPPGMGRPGR